MSIMRSLVVALFLFATPFWESKTPDKWTALEIDLMRTNSPWAQPLGPAPQVLAYLATAAPIEEAEAELRLRGRKPMTQPDHDYTYYLSEHRDEHFVLAIPYPTLNGLGKAEEQKRTEDESIMVVGRRKHHILGYFPPTPSDPVLRLVFPRDVNPADKSVVFRLYLGGLDFPEREIEFRVKDLIYRGKLAM